MGSIHRVKVETGRRLILFAMCGAVVGFFLGSSISRPSTVKVEMPRFSLNAEDDRYMKMINEALLYTGLGSFGLSSSLGDCVKIHEVANPRGAESLPPGIIEPYSDFYLHRLQGDPSEDLVVKPKYLLSLTVGYPQKDMVNSIVSKFSENFSVILFHYDGKASEWDQFEWSRRAIHISVKKQTKWWYAKRFLHPNIVAQYDYIFIWDEDLDVEHFNAEEYIKLIRKHDLEISQPGLDPSYFVWSMTKKRDDVEVHKEAEDKPNWCAGPLLPPCAAFVEIMAPVFSREAWRCVWHMIQNDLVHGWGLDLALQRCLEVPHERIGVVDAQWIKHKAVPSLGNQGQAGDGRQPWEGVRARCNNEWREFERRMDRAEKEYFHSISISS
ncbi:hypothetical protein VitviT2T_002228 [Vitis vinifera]|uniref:Lysine ketoglutarate reductase trans-splicing protein n=1 Tax=Vitis vinifera TaxID=29760 RepID=A0ABY9BHU9_VITVI|nr:uncharacterized protein LOC100264208 [Vitis vinifera]WJZ82469.1 hypothetical protein VitviT2T_002228 [Vitis vinifera]WJZ82470.1 hypothetical protein VitviT2T_002228 [Vitis vinifera]